MDTKLCSFKKIFGKGIHTLPGPSKGFGRQATWSEIVATDHFQRADKHRNYRGNHSNLRERQTACSIAKPKYNFSFCSKATTRFNTMEQTTEQLQSERQATQDTALSLEGPTSSDYSWHNSKNTYINS